VLVVDDAHPSDLVGRTIGERYVLVRHLGGGGMGAVYEARHQWTGRRVALKLLHPQHQLDATLMQRFVREAQAATAIQHPNIVDVLDMGQDQGLLYMVQELLDGCDLAAELEARGRLTPQEALDLIFPVMGALVAAHQRAILHRDIKPENIFLARTKAGVVPKVIDFGIAKVLEGRQDGLRTGTGRIIGTPAYMAPEQVRGDVRVDARVDVWAVGVVLFQMLSGQLPFDGATVNLVMLRIMTTAAPRLCDVAPDVPAAIGACVDRALVADRDARYPSMRAFLAALLDCPDRVSGLDAEGLRDRAAQATLPDVVDPASEAPTPPRDRTGLGAAELFDDLTDVRPPDARPDATAPDQLPLSLAGTEPLRLATPDLIEVPQVAADAVSPPPAAVLPAGLAVLVGEDEAEVPTRVAKPTLPPPTRVFAAVRGPAPLSDVPPPPTPSPGAVAATESVSEPSPRVVHGGRPAAEGNGRSTPLVLLSAAVGVVLLVAVALWITRSPVASLASPETEPPQAGAAPREPDVLPAAPPVSPPAVAPPLVPPPLPTGASGATLGVPLRPHRVRARPRRGEPIGDLPPSRRGRE